MDSTESTVVDEVEAICDVCLVPIEDGQGAVWVTPPACKPRRPVPWRITHFECQGERAGYPIEVERIRTWAGFLHWTAHLMGKDWIGYTDWDQMTLDTLNPTSGRVGGLRPRMLRDPGHRCIGD